MHASNNNFWFNFAGAWVGWIDDITGTYSAISDKRLKTNIRPMETILDRVMQLKVSRYEFIKNNPLKKVYWIYCTGGRAVVPRSSK